MFERAVTLRARASRSAIAYVSDNFVVTYGQMANDIARAALWLNRQGILEGDRVLLQMSSVYRQWILFFALEELGAVSMATGAGSGIRSRTLKTAGATTFITDIPPAEPMEPSGLVLDSGWLKRIRKLRPLPLPSRKRSSDDPICIVVSSGTTGIPKKVLFTRALLDARILTPQTADLIHASARVVLQLPHHSIGALSTALKTWFMGATLCIAGPNLSIADFLLKYDPTLIVGAPAHYAQFLAALPADFKPKRAIHTTVGGGALTSALGAAVRRVFLGGTTMIYGSTETGYMTRGDDLLGDDERAVGFAWPWMEIEIRGPEATVLPAGEIGEVWVRGSHVFNGYLEDAQAESSGFRDGWFHPGDLGSIRADGMVLIHGRTDDLMNFRGAKYLPSSIEAKVRKLGLTEDVAAFKALDPDSSEPALWLSCVAAETFDPSVLADVVPRTGAFFLAFVDALPRNAMGKVERVVLTELAEAGTLPAVRFAHPRAGSSRPA